jgi:hypothetical protein
LFKPFVPGTRFEKFATGFHTLHVNVLSYA